MSADAGYLLALDVGAARIGVAIASSIARLPRPLTTLTQSETLFEDIAKLVDKESVSTIVVGYPRGMQGQHTAQTDVIEDFVTQLKEHLALPIHFQDEALTSRKAEAELEARGKTYAKGDIDALAATYILEDFLLEHAEGVA